ncbi:MAG: hypothetical protein M1818_000593 [Claussenomyces sp. TS43310]|nr:MAG: hypothetical protein M1818_000593 [Claussenomyces sp. TS43310]
MQSQSPVEIIVRLPEGPNEGLDLATAFKRQPDKVRDALLEAIRQIGLRSADVELLKIHVAFESAQKNRFSEPRDLRPVLEACREGKLKDSTEGLFYEYREEYGIVALSTASRIDNRLLRDIDQLPVEDRIKLIHDIRIPEKAAISDFVDDFKKTEKSFVSDPPPQFKRPRMRKKGQPSSKTIAQPSQSPHSQPADYTLSDSDQRNKRRRSNSTSNEPAQRAFQVGVGASPLREYRLILPPILLDDPQALPNHQSYPHTRANGYISGSNYTHIDQQPLSDRERQRAPLQLPKPQVFPQQPPAGLEGEWELTDNDFVTDRYPLYDPQQPPPTGFEEGWELRDSDFVTDRYPLYDPQQPPPTGIEEGWELRDNEFVSDRYPLYDPQQPPPTGIEEGWELRDNEFVSDRYPLYDPQQPPPTGLEGR